MGLLKCFYYKKTLRSFSLRRQTIIFFTMLDHLFAKQNSPAHCMEKLPAHQAHHFMGKHDPHHHGQHHGKTRSQKRKTDKIEK